MKPILLLVLVCFLSAAATAQCSFTPTVTGNTLLCPLSTSILGTQSYNTYQWYSRPFSGGTSQPIPGATGATLEVSSNDVPFYVSVAGTLNGCTEQGPEVLVDGLAFLPLTVLSDGNFDIGSQGEMIICAGQPAYLIALQPYTTNFTWYDGTDAIPGATDDTLVLTQPGEYWLTASPGECPHFLDALGVQIHVVWSDAPGCTPLSAPEPPTDLEVKLWPNPAQNLVHIALPDASPVVMTVCEQTGRTLRRESFESQTELYVGDLPWGAYILYFTSGKGIAAKKLVVKN